MAQISPQQEKKPFLGSWLRLGGTAAGTSLSLTPRTTEGPRHTGSIRTARLEFIRNARPASPRNAWKRPTAHAHHDRKTRCKGPQDRKTRCKGPQDRKITGGPRGVPLADNADPYLASSSASERQHPACAQDLTLPPAGCRYAPLPGTLLLHLQNRAQDHVPGPKLVWPVHTVSAEVRGQDPRAAGSMTLAT